MKPWKLERGQLEWGQLERAKSAEGDFDGELAGYVALRLGFRGLLKVALRNSSQTVLLVRTDSKLSLAKPLNIKSSAASHYLR